MVAVDRSRSSLVEAARAAENNTIAAVEAAAAAAVVVLAGHRYNYIDIAVP